MAQPREPGPLDDDLTAIGSLQEPMRRSLYRYVAGQPAEVSRDEAAGAVGVQRSLAAFHLDKLVEAGLLEVTYRRLTGRTGPGAGRPAKLYRRSSREHSVSLPPRQYDLAAELLAEAVEEAGDRPVRESLVDVASRFGRRLGKELRATLSARTSRERRLIAIAQVLERYGYEPRREGRAVRLGNCPFHALSERHRDLVCGMNLSLLEGVVDGMEGADLEARRDPRPGECCVTVTAQARRT
ncbi:MAG: transcriptional regulator [Actinobacteria bacterium]|nr:transcriptional regulator [Actinomycetota bacterium]